jgi:2,3-bisphosphoglycerate-independent phosphoglycerate mutase
VKIFRINSPETRFSYRFSCRIDYIRKTMSEPDKNTPPRPVVLCILDGWGERASSENNAIALGDTPNWDRLVSTVPKAHLDASAEDVGLPSGQMGNSEVGHMNLGAGRVVMQDLPRIDKAVADGNLRDNPELTAFINKLKQTGGTCHLMGLMSPGGVHSHHDHLVALAGYVCEAGVPVRVHAFMDGRDTPPKAGRGVLEDFLNKTAGFAGCAVGTVIGRYWAMDRDNRWERVVRGYEAMVNGEGLGCADPLIAMDTSYAADTGDEFVEPSIIADYGGMADGDGLLMGNFRADRAREILAALADPVFDGFERSRVCDFPARLGMVEYSAALNPLFPALFPSTELSGIMGQIVADAGKYQLRIAETEKYAHVTFFLNGGREDVFDGEERILVPSPRVATYDLQPEMSAPEVTNKLIEAINSATFDLIVVNYANGDMVGHTGILDAAIKAAGALDRCLGRLEEAVIKSGGVMFVTADHGNCESMYDPKANEPHTQHTLNVVPALLVNAPGWVRGLKPGRLCDVAPTLLRLMGLPQPLEMTGVSLLDEGGIQSAAAE